MTADELDLDSGALHRYRDLRERVRAALDLDQGLADLTAATRYASLRHSVTHCLDLEVGLGGALATSPPPARPSVDPLPRPRAASGSPRPVLAEPLLAEPRAEPALAESMPAESTAAGPAPGEPARTEPPQAEPPRAEPPRAEPPRAEPPRTEPMWTERTFGASIRVARRDPGDVPYELVARAMTGDRLAVEDVITTIRPLVVRYCRARLGWFDRSSVSADDVAQEVCLAVLTALPGYRVQGRPFLAFVYGIASHKVIDAHRAAARNRSEPVPEVPDGVESADGPEQRTLRVELSEQMGRMLDKLPDKQREILVLRVVVGLSAEETAAAVGSSPGAVRVAQHRALARLRKAMPGGQRPLL